MQKMFASTEKGLNLKKEVIIAFLLGVVMIYFQFLFEKEPGFKRVQFDLFAVIQIFVLSAAIILLNKDYKIALYLLEAYLIMVLLGGDFYSFFPFLNQGRSAWVTLWSKYAGFPYNRVLEFFLIAGVIYGLNKGNRYVSITCASLYAVFEAGWMVFSRHSGLSSDMGDNFMEIAMYAEVVLPIVVLVCAISPRYIRNSVKIIDGYLAVRLVLLIVGNLMRWGELPEIPYLLNICWVPLMLILGLNSVLLFPISARELGKVFGMSCLVIVYAALVAVAQQSAEEGRRNAEEKREAYLNEMQENILSWKEAGFSESFTLDAAKSMLEEGRINYSEYQMLIEELLRS